MTSTCCRGRPLVSKIQFMLLYKPLDLYERVLYKILVLNSELTEVQYIVCGGYDFECWCFNYLLVLISFLDDGNA